MTEETETEETEETETVLLTAGARDVPGSHDGSTTFTFELRFSEQVPLNYSTLRDHAFTVTGGEVVNGAAAGAGEQRQEKREVGDQRRAGRERRGDHSPAAHDGL